MNTNVIAAGRETRDDSGGTGTIMRIERVESVQPPTPGSPPDWRTQLGQILVRVTTDEGLEGVGVGGGGLAGVHVIESVLRDTIVGREFERPDERELW